MPIVRTTQHPLDASHRPEWCKATSAGIFKVPKDGGSFDCHFHDCNEYWLIFAGKAKVMSEGQAFYVGSGDIVCTMAGDEHDILEVYEDLEGFWFEDETPPGGRIGHLHKDEAKANGHSVPGLPLPVDFK